MVNKTQKQVEDIAAEAQKTVNEGVEKLTRGMEDAAQFGQENLEAVVASSKIAAKAHETVGAEVAAYSKKSYEDSLAAAKELTSSKSVTEFVEKQTAFTKSLFEGFVAEATKINDIYTAAAKEAFEPLNQRYSAAVERMKSARA